MTSFDMQATLTTERLHLVPCSNEHLDGLSAMNSDPEVMRYITGRPETRSETCSMIERVRGRWAEYGYSWWTIMGRSSAEILGAGCVQNLRRGDQPDSHCPLEIGWRLRREHWGHGYATEAARAMAKFAFTRLGADALYAVCDPDNIASIRVTERLGMHCHGSERWQSRELTIYAISAEQWHRLSSA